METTGDRPLTPADESLRVDAVETPLADLRETDELTAQGHGDAYDEDGT